MRCPICEHENSPKASHCEACDAELSVLDLPSSIERYRRAFDKLVVDGFLSERAEKQCQKLRTKLKISEAFHERLLAELEPEEPETLALSLAMTLQEDGEALLAILHRGDFTFERVEITVLSTRLKRLYREEGGELEPDEQYQFKVSLVDDQVQGPLIDLGVQFQVRAVDITDEVLTLRSPFFSLSGGESELIDLDGASATDFAQLTERRGLYSLLGGEGWRELPLRVVEEDDYFQWEVQVSAHRDWRRRAAGGGWRVGDQSLTPLGNLEFSERLCPGGISWMGAPLGVGRDWEVPAHQVKIHGPIWCTDTPITQATWEEVMGENPSAFTHRQHPVEQVSWWDAISFCNRLSRRLGLRPVYQIDDAQRVFRDARASGYRLPTEAEWEHLARAGLDRAYAGSNQPAGVCWSLEESEMTPQPVAQKNPNAWGLFDLCGNVWEWCEDLFSEDAYRSRLGVTSNPKALHETLRGEEGKGGSRVRRGGSWATPALMCKVFSRADGDPSWQSHFVGLRVVREEKAGITPNDRLVKVSDASWAHLHRGAVYLAGVASSPKRMWAVRLEALGVKLCENEDNADVVVVIAPNDRRGLAAKLKQLNRIRSRAMGGGALVLSTDELEPLLETREAEVHELEHEEERWHELFTRRVMLVGRFRTTQRVLAQRLVARGVRLTQRIDQVELLVA